MLTLVLVVSLAAGPAADTKVDAKVDAMTRDLIAAAKKLFTQKRYTDAMEKFRSAYQAGGDTASLYNIGKCHERLGNTAMALRSYREYRRVESKAEKDAVLEGDIANGERRLREKGVQQLVVYADPPTAQIRIDGHALEPSPAYVELRAGEHVLVVSANGYETTQYSFVMNVATIAERTVKLHREGEPLADTPTMPPLVVVTPREPVDGRPSAAVEASLKPRARVGTWVSGGVAVAGAATAVGLGVAFLNADKQLHTFDPNRLGTQTEALMSRSSNLATGTNIAISVAATAAATAVVLFFVEGK